MSESGQATSRRVQRRARLAERNTTPDIDEEDTTVRIVDPDDPSIQGSREADAPEDALAEAARISKEKDDKIAAAEKRAKDAEADAARARAASGQSALDALARQEETIKGNVTTAEAAKTAATAKYRAARDAGDLDAEMAAMQEMSEASAAHQLAKATAANFDNWKAQNIDKLRAQTKPQPAARATTGGDEVSPETRRWIGTHPLYNIDEKYRAEAMSAHELALADLGEEADGTQAYVDYVDKHMEKIYGKGHGQIDHGNGRGQERMDNRNQNRNASTAAPKGEGERRRSAGSRPQGGGEEIEYTHTDGSRLRLVRGVDNTGKPYETVVGTIPAEWREYAKITGMKDIPYAIEQIKIADGMENGGPESGLAYQRDGVYR